LLLISLVSFRTYFIDSLSGQVQQQIFMIQATEAELDPPDLLGASSWEGDESAAMMFGQEIQNRKVGTQTFFSS
jgi:hypothetical protein